MSECQSIEPLVTPFVDGDLPASEREAITRHLTRCAPCRARVEAEQSVCDMLRSRRRELASSPAPGRLRARCASLVAARTDVLISHVAAPVPLPGRTPAGSAGGRQAWRTRALPLALAASLLVALTSVAVYRLTQSSVRVMAAELTADHVKCFVLHGGRTDRPASADVERALASMFGWSASLPGSPEQAGLELVGARPCLYAEGRVAHIMYRYQGRPVSVFMLPDTERAEELFEVMGHRAVAWTSDGRTFVLVAREPAADVERLAQFVHAGLR